MTHIEDELEAIGQLSQNGEMVSARIRAYVENLHSLIARASEELRMIEMKDSSAIYDVGLRMALRQALPSQDQSQGGD